MVSWIVIIVLIIVAIFAVKLNNLRHRFFIILLVLLTLFLYTTMSVVTNQNDLDFKSSKGIFVSIKVYTMWLVNGFDNLKELTGKAIEQDWISNNRSFIGENSKFKISDKK